GMCVHCPALTYKPLQEASTLSRLYAHEWRPYAPISFLPLRICRYPFLHVVLIATTTLFYLYGRHLPSYEPKMPMQNQLAPRLINDRVPPDPIVCLRYQQELICASVPMMQMAATGMCLARGIRFLTKQRDSGDAEGDLRVSARDGDYDEGFFTLRSQQISQLPADRLFDDVIEPWGCAAEEEELRLRQLPVERDGIF
ncbi:MAG: hypothetical protein ACRDL7_11270, partial [Gaiellaceae bacterium]